MRVLELDLNTDERIIGALGSFAGRRTPEPGEVGARETGGQRRFAEGVDEGELSRAVHVAEVGDATRRTQLLARRDHSAFERRAVGIEGNRSIHHDPGDLFGRGPEASTKGFHDLRVVVEAVPRNAVRTDWASTKYGTR